MSNPETIRINEIEYVRKDSVKDMDSKYVIVRGRDSGVFAGYLVEEKGQEITLSSARRIWYWDGAASLSQLAMSGTRKPENCKFPEPMSEVIVKDCIELICCTTAARESIESVKIWKE